MLYFKILLTVTLFLQLISGNVTNGATQKSHCNGIISIAYEDYEGEMATIILESKRSKYKNLRKGFPEIKDKFVTYIEILGDCCWKIYSKRKFKGEMKVVYPTEDILYIDFQPVSVRRTTECV